MTWALPSPRTLFLILLLFFAGCRERDEKDGLFLLAARALGPEAHQDREMVFNPRLLGPENPRMSGEAISLLQEGGLELTGGDGLEDPQKATLYFTPPEVLEEGRYELRVYVSLGARFGTMHRGDTWWRVLVDCPEVCEVQEIARISSPGGGRSSSPR